MSLYEHHLYKHLHYIDLVSFNMQPWNCYLKDTASFFQHWVGLTGNSYNVYSLY